MDRPPALVALIDRYPRFAALIFGLLAATGFPPLTVWPLALLGMAGMIHLAARAPTVRRAAMIGWLFGVGHFTLANNWIATAFTYQADMPQWLGWLAVPLLAVYLGIYPALAALAVRWLGRGTAGTLPLALLAAAAWIVTEWLRSWVFTGYAWAPFSLALLGPFERPGLAALLPWFGTYGLSGLAVLIAVGWWRMLVARRWIGAGLAAALLIAGMHMPAPAPREGTLAFTLVQPDVRQEELDDPSKFEEQFQRIARLTRRTESDRPRIVLWPESGVPDYLRDGYPQRYYNQMTAAGDPRFARYRIGRTIGPDSVLLTGAVDLEIRDGRAAGARNAVTALDSQGRIVGGYAKAHLVPYGEYLALRWLLEPLGASRLVAGTIDFWPGPGPRTLDLGIYGRAGIQICYETIFSGQVVDRNDRPDYIFNPSNEGWFGSWGPPQFTAQSRMRAIEEGLPMLRSTTTGISSVIDAHGVVRQHLPMHRADRIDGTIPAALPPTLFSKTGNTLPLGWAMVALLLSLVAMRRARR